MDEPSRRLFSPCTKPQLLHVHFGWRLCRISASRHIFGLPLSILAGAPQLDGPCHRVLALDMLLVLAMALNA